MSSDTEFRIFVLTQEEPFYLPRFFSAFLASVRATVVGVNIMPPFNGQTSWKQVITDHLGLYGAKDFLIQGTYFALYKVLDKLPLERLGTRPYSVLEACRRHGVPAMAEPRINSQPFLDKLRGERVDLVVSVACPRIIKQELLELPPHGCINFHAGYLPRYRGINPSFWSLLNDERESAITIHKIDEKLDNGDIVAQEVIPIAPDETLHSLFMKVVTQGPQLMIRCIEDITAGRVELKKNEAEKATYFRFPTPEDGRRFRQKGKRFR